MNLSRNLLVAAALVSLTFVACQTEEDDDAAQQSASTVTFADVSSIFETNCQSCHNSSIMAGNLLLTNYAEIKEATQSGNVLSRINSSDNPMPVSGLMSQENRDLIQDWADGGYLEN